ncbi:LexA family protein [Exiguobacterium antarcticum]|uniref:LexA family protein n=1 Tax=Exiguobacterium antarcticum TaxID=132920 RepID=UPI000478F6D4|nr:hypothetical protein [Exiguobacterium antarcticum]
MSERTKEVLDYVYEHYVHEGYMPTIRTIGKDLHMSYQRAHQHMKKLEEAGHVKYLGRYCLPVLKQPTIEKKAVIA